MAARLARDVLPMWKRAPSFGKETEGHARSHVAAQSEAHSSAWPSASSCQRLLLQPPPAWSGHPARLLGGTSMVADCCSHLGPSPPGTQQPRLPHASCGVLSVSCRRPLVAPQTHDEPGSGVQAQLNAQYLSGEGATTWGCLCLRCPSPDAAQCRKRPMPQGSCLP